MRAYGWLGSENSQLSEKGLLVTSLQALKDIKITQEHTSKMQIPRPHLQRDSGSLGLREYLLENLPFSSTLADSDAEHPRITLWETVTYDSSESWVKYQVFPKLHRVGLSSFPLLEHFAHISAVAPTICLSPNEPVSFWRTRTVAYLCMCPQDLAQHLTCSKWSLTVDFCTPICRPCCVPHQSNRWHYLSSCLDQNP